MVCDFDLKMFSLHGFSSQQRTFRKVGINVYTWFYVREVHSIIFSAVVEFVNTRTDVESYHSVRIGRK